MPSAIPITFRRMVGSQGMPTIMRVPEAANAVFKEGTPVVVSDGYANNAAEQNNNATQFSGFSTEYGKNRAANGTEETLTFGSVRNQNNAVLIPVGAPMDDGNVGIIIPGPEARFMGALEYNNNAAQNMVGDIMGLTEDSNNYWYIDPAKNNMATGGCIRITKLISDAGTAGGKLEFSVIQTRVIDYSPETPIT
jgi:hypothetical protein